MKLTKEEYQNLVDSRLVDLKASIDEYQAGEPIVDDNTNIGRLQTIVNAAEALYDAYDAKVMAEEEVAVIEGWEKYEEKFGGKE